MSENIETAFLYGELEEEIYMKFLTAVWTVDTLLAMMRYSDWTRA